MAVTITALISVLLVLAITYNQGAARPMACATMYGSSSSEESQWDCHTYMIPTVIKKGLGINITGEIDPDATDKSLTVVLSKSGKDSCQFKFNFSTETITVDSDLNSEAEIYELTVNSTGISFSLMITARQDMFMMSFFTYQTGPSNALFCKIDNFDEINQIDIKEGVARVDSLLFKFEK